MVARPGIEPGTQGFSDGRLNFKKFKIDKKSLLFNYLEIKKGGAKCVKIGQTT